jgi:hypothetical protein
MMFTVIANDSEGECVRRGGDRFEVMIKGETETVKPSLEDHLNGTYSCTYSAYYSGKYTISIALHDEAIEGSPFEVLVGAGVVCPARSIASGEGIFKAQARRTAEVVIQANDDHAEHIKIGGNKFGIRVEKDDGLVFDGKVEDQNDGTYWGSYVCPHSGPYKVFIFAFNEDEKEEQIFGSPFSIIASAGDANATKTIAIGDGTRKADTKLPTTFIVQVRDDDGVDAEWGGTPVTVSIPGSKGLVEVRDMDDGTYEVTYSIPEIGVYELHVTIDGQGHIIGSPFTLTVGAETEEQAMMLKLHPRHFVVKGTGVSEARVLETADFTISLHDKEGNPVNHDGLDFHLRIDDRPSTDFNVWKLGFAQYGMSWVPPEVGFVQLHIEDALQRPVAASPFQVKVLPADTVAEKCEVSGRGSEYAQPEEPTEFLIHAYDKYDNRTDGAKFTVTVSDHPDQKFVVDGVVTDRHDGTYRVAYELRRSGPHMMSIVLNQGPSMRGEEAHIKGSPFRIFSEIGPIRAINCRLHGQGLENARLNERASFQLVAHDRYGTQLKVGAANIRVCPPIIGGIQLEEEEQRTFDMVKIEDNLNGTYDIHYVPRRTGSPWIVSLVKQQICFYFSSLMQER